MTRRLPGRSARHVARPSRARTVVRTFAWTVFLVLVAVAVAPRVLPVRTLAVMSGSMAPSLPVGGLALAVPVAPDRVEVGDIITFDHPRLPGKLVSHRVVAIDAGGRLTTKGDANPAADAWSVQADRSGWKVVGAVPFLGRVVGGAADPRLLLAVVGVALLALLREVWAPSRAPVHAR